MRTTAADLDRRELVDSIRAAVCGDRPIVTIVGEPGIGKTTLLARSLSDVPADWTWQVECLEAEADLGLAVLAGLFEAIPDDTVRAVPEPQQHAIDVVLYRASYDGAGAVTDRLLGATTVSVLRGLLERGSVRLVIDDLQWCDPTSLAALRFALARIDDPALCLVSTARTGQVPPLPRARDISVGPLDAEATRRLVRSIAPRARTARIDAVAASSGGNPFFARELARALATNQPGALPGSLRAALDRRLDALPDATHAALLDVAIRGDIRHDEIAIDDLDAAFRADVIRIVDGRVGFTHPLLASATIEAATPGAKRRARLRAAEATDDPVLRGLHRAQAEPASAELAAELDQAVIAARQRADWTSVRTLARSALAATPDGPRPTHRLVELADAEVIVGDVSAAEPLVDEVLARSTNGPELVRAAAIKDIFVDEDSTAAALFGALAERAGLTDDVILELRILQAMRLRMAGRVYDALDVLTEVLPAEHNIAWSQVIGNIAMYRRMAGLPIEQDMLDEATRIERAASHGAASGAPLVDARVAQAIVAYFDDRHDDARRWMTETERAAAIRGWPSRAMWYATMLETRRGRLDEAIRLSTDAVQEIVGQLRVDALIRQGWALVWIDAHAVAAIVAEADATLVATDLRLRADAAYLDGFNQLLAGRPRDAWPTLLRAVELVRRSELREPSRTPALLVGAEAAVAVGDLDTAQQYCDELAELTERSRSRWGTAAIARVRGLIAEAAGDASEAEDLLAESAASFHGLGVPLEAARSYLAVGALRRRIGHRRDARAALDRARQIGVDCGSPRLIDIADGELARLGGRVRANSDELTESELQVARLAADGLRNKDIAANLHISTKTVEAHLGRAFRKLNVSGRTALARELARRSH